MDNCHPNNDRILITGGSGFIGTNLVAYYASSSHAAIMNIDLLPPRNVAQNLYHEFVDIRDEATLSDVLEKFRPTTVFHLAARTDLDGKLLEDYSSNTDGVQTLVTCLKKMSSPPRIVLYASSRLVCEIGHQPKDEYDVCPTTIYGESKVIGERLIRDDEHNMFKWIIFRPTSIWGPWFDVPYRTFFDAVRSHRYFHPSGKKITKSFGFVGNSIYQLDRLAFSSDENIARKTVYLCDYEPLEVGEWANSIAKQSKVTTPIRLPYILLKLLAKLGDIYQILLKRPAPLTTFRLNNLVTNMIHDTQFVANVVGPLPYDLTKSVEITCNWMNGH